MSFGALGLLFFSNRNGRYGSAVAIIIGLLLLLRARKVLTWHGALFWLVSLLAVIVPIALFLPAVLR
jgi:hypothetical protein